MALRPLFLLFDALPCAAGVFPSGRNRSTPKGGRTAGHRAGAPHRNRCEDISPAPHLPQVPGRTYPVPTGKLLRGVCRRGEGVWIRRCGFLMRCQPSG